MLRSAAVFLLVLVAALYLFAQFLRRTGMFYPQRYPLGDWDVSRLVVRPEEHRFSTTDGVRLHAWLFRAFDASAPTLVWFHGNGGNISDRADLAAEFARRGVTVLLFDWRGYGKSEGTPTEGKLYRDSVAAYDYAANQLHATNIVAYGESLGGPYAAYVASERKVRCVVIENSFPSLRRLGNTLYAPLPLGWAAPRAMATLRWLNDANVPVLILHGRRDQVIPFALGKELHDELRTPKEMFVSETAGHSEIPFTEGPRYYDAVTAFIAKHAR